MSVRHIVRPDGARIAWREAGRPDASPVLLCTMATAAMGAWDPLTAALGGRWRFILHDRRGEGGSDPGAPETHRFETFRDDALAVLDAAGVEQAAVCGMAFGARVAQRLALDTPKRVACLALFDATGGPPAPESERSAGRAEARRLRDAAGLASPDIDPAWFARRDPAGKGLNSRALKDEPAWRGLEGVACPVLVACGEQDPNLAGARRLAAETRDARFVAMPMTGHASILDRPDLVADLLASFLADRYRSPQARATETGRGTAE